MQLGAQQQWAVDSFFRNAVQGQPILIRGDGETTRDYIYIDDVVDFVIMAIENSSISGVYNLGTGVGTSLNQLVKIIGGIVKKPLKLNYSPSRNFDLDYIVLSIKKALATGWEPKFNLQKGIADIYNKYEKNR
jgi:UDP-glucose 4-epimerase